ncbi:hypothetical protein PybrP1_001714 [[Pythium] brassicae (nom. inval.)]|nr:hypothetical protein PybrP1_001714 [[Pythium] brassicae (nom. inval.)]
MQLQQLHQQLNAKWNELQECYRQGGRAAAQLYQVKIIFRVKLPYFPESISAKVFEQGLFSGSAISTASKRDREHAAKHGTSFCEAAACRRHDAITNRGGVEAGRWEHEVFEEPVPLEDSEIASDERYVMLLRSEVKEFDRRLRAEHAEEGEFYSVERQHKLSLLKIHDFIDRVKHNQLVTNHRAIAHERAKTLASIIQEQPLPLFPGTLDLSGLGNLFAPRRRLRPQAARRSVPNALAEWPTCCELYIQVQKATNVPQVSNYESQVFVEVCFQGKKRRTSCSPLTSTSSANPVWMETLVVPFRPPLDDWSPDSIQRCQDEIRINLFDQLVLAGDDDGDQLDALAEDKTTGGMQQRSFRQEYYFLGGLCVPFTTLYNNSGSIEAMLRCDMPIEHLGYVNLKCDDDDAISIGTPRVKLFETTVAPPVGSQDAGESSKRLAHYATDWMLKTRTMNAATKQRNFCVFARNLSNGSTFFTQFIGVQQPPRSGPFSQSRTTLQKLVRFVKLLPFLDDWHLFDGEKDVWSTSQEFLAINAGDHEEHAVLLCNLFRWLDRNDPNLHNYLVVGHAVPEGDGVYVLRQDAYKIPQRSVLWNASTGVGYHVWDERCPMRDVSLVVSSDNIFANVQPAARFRDLTWDVEANPKAWKPFFHPKTVQKDAFALPCVQTKALVYEETPDEYVVSVEMEIRETLKLEIRRWRSSRWTTVFNVDVGLRLRGHLEQLERCAQGEPGPSEEALKSARVLLETQQAKDVSGMPLNTTFTDLQKVVELVKNTNIHRNERANVEFALAVYVCGFPNCVLSVWVYLVSLVPI